MGRENGINLPQDSSAIYIVDRLPVVLCCGLCYINGSCLLARPGEQRRREPDHFLADSRVGHELRAEILDRRMINIKTVVFLQCWEHAFLIYSCLLSLRD